MIARAAPPMRARAAECVERVHDAATELFARMEGGCTVREDRWERPGGGGGVTRVITRGAVWEKAGINRSRVEGPLPAGAAERLGGRAGAAAGFFATGVSLVAHPRSPMIPTVHLNVRYFELEDADGAPLDAWFGGGTDLTPTYPHQDDAAHFHRVLAACCGRHGDDLYPRFKAWCDRYFVNEHRGGERRGVGGIFYDHLRPGDGGMDGDALLSFMAGVGTVLEDAYAPIVARRRDEPWGRRERRLQLARRGRYAEFNLLHDRGTIFGLRTGARVESVLMSLPPLARWDYAPEYAAGSIEARLVEMLEPRDWAAWSGAAEERGAAIA
ncbi:MAG TPA: oxygen-dependent coproporphyrinogen oxidase [Longimicrobium sp.]|nr:oxygen-dependent coproporphyrinogen oxidase [Longimicrobium sp.]